MLLFLLLFSLGSYAQQPRVITGTVVAADGSGALAGASVNIKGTAIGTVTDIDGKFSLSIPSDAKDIEISYLGYEKQTLPVSNKNVFNIELNEQTKQIDEVVVVGYGTQQKKLVTGAIVGVNSKDIATIPNDGRVETALQGRTPGVIVASNSGQPGDASTVRIRGISTIFSGNNPLWVVDGIITSDISYLNQADIQSIEVLKDAASAAIYGTRAGNGVILVTTKQGGEGKFSVSYNGFAGTTAPARLMPLTNATQYATLMNEMTMNGMATSGIVTPLPYPDPSSLGAGTDWQKAIFNDNAFRTNHDLSLQGGSEKANIFVSLGYQDQQGIILPQVSEYQKYSFRLNHNENFGKIFKFGQSISYARTDQKAVSTNSQLNGPVIYALNMDPLTPVIATEEQEAAGSQYQQSPFIVRTSDGRAYGMAGPVGTYGAVGQEIVNPVAWAQTVLGNHNYADRFVGNTYLEIDPIKELAIRSQISLNRTYSGSWSFSPQYYLNGNIKSFYTKTDGTGDFANALSLGNSVGTSWNWDNTVSFTKSISQNTFGIMLGGSISEDALGQSTSVQYRDLQLPDYNNYKEANSYWPKDGTQTQGSMNTNYTPHKVISFFGRLNYNYAQKYLATVIIRSDGSTRFGTDNKWGTFPSVSLGWVPSLEKFWTVSNDAIDFLKIRAGYGVTGNDSFGDFYYTSTISSGNWYPIGADGSYVQGQAPTTLSNPNLKWEQTSQLDLGLDLHFLRNFTFSFDYFDKKTSGVLLLNLLPSYAGVTSTPWANVGDIDNRGVELQLGYNKRLGDWTVGATANFATLKNRVTALTVGTPYVTGQAATVHGINSGPITRSAIGYPVNGFWGVKTNGIFQTPADVQNYKSSDGTVIQPNAAPGDFRWVDQNDDGTIDSKDVTYLGSPMPTYNYGLNLTFGYGNKSIGLFDLTIFIQGQGGNTIFQQYHRLDVGPANFTLDYLNRWTGAGSTNSFPILLDNTADARNNNYSTMSDFYLHKGDFMRLKNVQLGYSLPAKVSKAITAEKIRIYLAAENLATLTGYNGYDPEIGGNVFGIDSGNYPLPRTLMVGLNLQF